MRETLRGTPRNLSARTADLPAAAERAGSIASSDFARQVSDKRGVPIGHLLPKTLGRIVQQCCHETHVNFHVVYRVAADLAEARSSNRKSLAENAGRVVQQGCIETHVNLAAVDLVAADLAAPRDLLGDG